MLILLYELNIQETDCIIMVNDYVHLFVIVVHMAMKDTIFMNVVYMYIHYQRTENERLAHNQVNIPTIAVGAHEQKTEGPFSLS